MPIPSLPNTLRGDIEASAKPEGSYALLPLSIGKAKQNPAYQEATIIVVPPSVRRRLYDMAIRNIPWEKIGEEVVRPVMDDISKGTEALKDSANSYMYRSTHPSDRLIEEAIADHFRKFGK